MDSVKPLFFVLVLAAASGACLIAGAQEETAGEAELKSGEVAAAAGEEAEREEEENRRRRRQPSETAIDLGDERRIRVTWTPVPADGRDYEGLAELEPGEVASITASAPPKLWTHKDLSFGDTTVPYGNVAENYPGVYGLWLRKTEDGWNLIFNNKPDVWGTMYDPDADAAEIPLEHSGSEAEDDALTIELTQESEGRGTLVLTWGEHQWSAPFEYGG